MNLFFVVDIRGRPSKTSAVRREGVCPVRTFFGQVEFFRCERPHFLADADVRTFWRKNFGFFEIYGVFARTGRGSIFRDFVLAFFMVRPLFKRKIITLFLNQLSVSSTDEPCGWA